MQCPRINRHRALASEANALLVNWLLNVRISADGTHGAMTPINLHGHTNLVRMLCMHILRSSYSGTQCRAVRTSKTWILRSVFMLCALFVLSCLRTRFATGRSPSKVYYQASRSKTETPGSWEGPVHGGPYHQTDV